MDSTVIRRVSMTAMLIGPSGEMADRVATRFEKAHITVVRAAHALAAGETLAVAMPQVVVVLGSLHADEREALTDRATAVGALLMYVDPELDTETLEELVARAAAAAIERKVKRDAETPIGGRSEPPAADDEVDSKW